MPRGYAWSTRLAAASLAIFLVAGNALVRGGVDPPVFAASCVVAAIALALAAGRHDESRSVSVLVIGLAVVVCLVGLQLVPLPDAVGRALSPRGAEILDEVRTLTGSPAAWRPLSLDLGETALELAKAALFTCAAALGALLGGSDRKRDLLLRGIALSGLAVVAVYFGAAFLGRSPLLEPKVTFVNPNHLAGFLQLAAWPSLGFALRAHGRGRVAWIVAFAFEASGIFLSLSRAGIAAFFVGAGLFSVLWMRTDRRRVRLRRRAHTGDEPGSTGDLGPVGLERPDRPYVQGRFGGSGPLVAAVGVAGTLAVSAWLALSPIVLELESVADTSTTELKLALWPMTIRMIREFPLAGIGRGAYGAVHSAYLPDQVGRSFTHVENEWLQLPVDLGLLAGPALIALFAWSFFAAARRRDLPRPFAGALAGVGALVAHNLFDFSLEVPGVALPFALVLGLASRDLPTIQVKRWKVRASAVAAFVAAAAGAAVHWSHQPSLDGQAVEAAAGADDALAVARRVFPWHPADWLIPAAVGAKLVEEVRCKEALPWLNGAMQRNPTAPQPHHALAWCLARDGQEAFAKREYRLAFSYGDVGALEEAHAVYPEPGALLGIAPETPGGLMAAGKLLSKRPDEAAEAFRRAWEAFQLPEALRGLAQAQLRLGLHEEALLSARQLQQVAPLQAGGYLLASQALDALERGEDAHQDVELGAARVPGNPEVLAALGERLIAQRRFSQARATFQRIFARDGPVLAWKHLLIARTYERQGRFQDAALEAQTARDVTPNRSAPLIFLSRVAAALGRYDEAVQSLEAAATMADAPPDIADQLAALRARRASNDTKRAAGVQ